MATSFASRTPAAGPAGGGPARAGGRRPRRRRGSGLAGPLFAAPSAAGLMLFTLVPIVMSLVMSFYSWPIIGERAPVGLENYRTLFASPLFLRVIGNTVLFTVLYLPLNLFVSIGLALWIKTVRRGRHALRVLFFIPVVTPIVANVVIWRMIYQPDGAIDGIAQVFGGHAPNFLGDPNWAMTAVVLMSVWQGFGYNLLVFSAALDGIPPTLNEAASLDGAGPWYRLWHVTLPMISPSLFFATVMTLISTFQVFIQPYLLTKGGPGISTQTLVQYVYQQGFASYSLGAAAAAAWVLFLIILLVTAVQFVLQRKWVTYDV